MIHTEPITVTNVLLRPVHEIAAFMNTHVLNAKIPVYTANQQLSIQADLVPLLSVYANNRAYVTELFNIVLSAYIEQKIAKKKKAVDFDDEIYVSLEGKKEVLYRTSQALDRMYEATSRLMTGIGQPDSNMNRY